MKTKRFILTAALPVLGVCLTSCNGSKIVSYNDAVKHAINNYDEHSIDYVKGNYAFKINKLSANLDITETNAVGIEKKMAVTAGLPVSTATYKDLPCAVLNSTYLGYIEEAYNVINEVTLEKFTDFKFDKEYLLNNGSLTVKIGTDDSVLGLIYFVNNVFNLAYTVDHSFYPFLEDFESMLSPVTQYLDKVYKPYNISIRNATSDATGKFNVELSTDHNGFITGLSLDFASDLNINGSFASRDDVSINYLFNAKGNIALGVNLAVSF